MAKLTPGQKAFRANIRAQKAIGRKNAATAKRTAKANVKSHLAAMKQRSTDAAALREAKRLEGIARRDAHNAQAKADKAARLAANDDQAATAIAA